MRPCPFDTVHHRSAIVTVGSCRIPAAHPERLETRSIREHCVVFPRTEAVWIEPLETRRFLADPSVALLYNRGQVYRRYARDERVDACDFIAFDEATLRSALDETRPSWSDARRPFEVPWVPVSSAVYLAQRRLVLRLARGWADAIEAEDGAFRLLDRLLEPAHGKVRADARQRELVIAVKERLGEVPFRAESLVQLAARFAVSPSHLSRVFRRVAGHGLAEYRDLVRLHRALEFLPEADDLTTLALDLGYAGHSHFTRAFARRFGLTPSAWRAQARATVGAAGPRPRRPGASSIRGRA